MILLITFSLLSFFLIIYYLCNKENWANTYSGWPGPLENPYRSNIPALYGNPKYEAPYNFKYNLRSNTNYLQMKDLPN